MGTKRTPRTLAVKALEGSKVPHRIHPYRYVERGGTRLAANALGVEEHGVIKTLVMEAEGGEPFLVLMHGDREVSTKALARILGVKKVGPCLPEKAQRITGYQVGGISPFGTRRPLKVYVEASIMDLPRIFINAGKRGLMAEISPADLKKVLNPIPVTVGT